MAELSAFEFYQQMTNKTSAKNKKGKNKKRKFSEISDSPEGRKNVKISPENKKFPQNLSNGISKSKKVKRANKFSLNKEEDQTASISSIKKPRLSDETYVISIGEGTNISDVKNEKKGKKKYKKRLESVNDDVFETAIQETHSATNEKKKIKKFKKHEKVGSVDLSSENDSETPDLPVATDEKTKIKKPKKSENEKLFILNQENSLECAENLFCWIIAPVTSEKFFSNSWETRPLHLARHCKNYYSSLLSCEAIDKILREESLFFTRNIDVTTYTDGERQTLNPSGRATAPLVWDFFNSGSSVRILNPQTYFKNLHSLNSKLQELFQCFVGANVYLTPAGTQGFAPHYDDIEAFVLQIEGCKKWKLYGPRDQSEILPSESSINFKEEDLGPLIMEVELQAGDMLYFPRGIIHQASAIEDTHSLHITLSVYQKNSWADYLEKLLPLALKKARENDVKFRQGLPLQYLTHMGVVNSEKETPERSAFIETFTELMRKLVEQAPVDEAADAMGAQFIHTSLPPLLMRNQNERTAFGDGEKWTGGKIVNVAEIEPDTRVKLITYNAIRLVTNEESIRVYYNVNNSKIYQGEEPQYLEINEDQAVGVEFLIKSYPNYVSVEDLPLSNDDEKLTLVADMWNLGILLTEEPIGNMNYD